MKDVYSVLYKLLYFVFYSEDVLIFFEDVLLFNINNDFKM